MKKIVLFFLALLFLSCSSDESNKEINPFIGVWKPIMQTIPISSDTILFNECEQRSRYQFSADGKISQWNIYTWESSNECFKKTQLITGYWTRTSDFNLNTLFELTLLDNLADSMYVTTETYDATFFEDHDKLMWRKSKLPSSAYLHLERVK